MGVMPERVEKQDVEARQFFQTLGWNRAMVRKIRTVSKAKAVDDTFAMRGPNGLKKAADHTNRVGFKQVWLETWTAGFARFSIEHVAESAFDHFPSSGRCVNRYLSPLHKVEWPNVIQT